EMKRLAMVLHVPLRKVLAKLEEGKATPLQPIKMAVAVHEDQVEYLQERHSEFPGVDTAVTYLRKYNTQALLAHVLGYVGEITPAELAAYNKQFKNCQLLRAKEQNVPCPGDRVGQSGVEQQYDSVLRGIPGEAKLPVRPDGTPAGPRTPQSSPVTGNPVQLTIDISLQRAA